MKVHPQTTTDDIHAPLCCIMREPQVVHLYDFVQIKSNVINVGARSIYILSGVQCNCLAVTPVGEVVLYRLSYCNYTDCAILSFGGLTSTDM